VNISAGRKSSSFTASKFFGMAHARRLRFPIAEAALRT
jgi:hypothetical protein